VKEKNNQLDTDLQTMRNVLENLPKNSVKSDNLPEEYLHKIQQLEDNELKRLNQEKTREKNMLIRDLFNVPKDKLLEQLQMNNLSEKQMDIFVDQTIDCVQLLSDYPILFACLETVAKQFTLTPDQLMFYLKEKKQSNYYFHININIKKYAKSRRSSKIYILNEFIESIGMHPLPTEDATVLQMVFQEICQIINNDGK
jgi:hypothetical protein